jgi:hypothetical protein
MLGVVEDAFPAFIMTLRMFFVWTWVYDFCFRRGECLPFDYTGCGGNSNRFHTKEQCESLCLRREPSIPIRIGLAGAGRVENVPHHPPVQQRGSFLKIV